MAKRRKQKGSRWQRFIAWLARVVYGDFEAADRRERERAIHANRSAGARKGWETRKRKQMTLDEIAAENPNETGA